MERKLAFEPGQEYPDLILREWNGRTVGAQDSMRQSRYGAMEFPVARRVTERADISWAHATIDEDGYIIHVIGQNADEMLVWRST